MTRGLGRFLRRNTIALLAVFLALGGTSYAAATLISGSQIKPHTIAKNRLTNKAIKQLRGNRGPRGLQGAQGARGPTGAQGVQGIQGPPGPFPDPLSPGKTVRGTFGDIDQAVGAGQVFFAEISFGFRLSAAPVGRYVPQGATPPAECPGTVTNPQAAPGNLCVYESTGVNVTVTRGTCDDELFGCGASFGVANREGTGIVAFSTAAGTMQVFGSWAVTAPTGSAPSHAHGSPNVTLGHPLTQPAAR
jgi:hypothetical protein